MPSLRHHDCGNMYIQFNVKFPEKGWTQDETAFDALRKILPPPGLINVPPTDAVTDPADLEDVENGEKGFDAMAIDEDEEGQGGPERVQCASQ